MPKPIKNIVLVGHDNEGSARLFDKITSAFPEKRFLLVITHGLYYRKSFFASVLKLLHEASWIFVFFRFLELVKFKLIGETLRQKAKRIRCEVIDSRDINSPATIQQISYFKPDLLISLFTMQIFEKPSLNVAKFGAITSHPSILPEYRGLEVFFWVLANNDPETGVSVFFLDEKIDAGRVFEQQIVPITPEMGVSSLYGTITAIGGDLLVKAVRDIEADTVRFVKSDKKDSYYHMPDRTAFRRFRRTGRKFFR